MVNDSWQAALRAELADLQAQGMYKHERVIASRQGATITLADGREVLNFCANNYLGLADHPQVMAAAAAAIDRWGNGMASVRFICGSQTLHHELEQRIAGFVGGEAAISYAAAFDANGGLFEPLLTDEDAIISDELNHASIIDGVRLCKAQRYRYRHSDMNQLEERLRETQDHRRRIICTDGVFSMDGDIANLPEIVELAERCDAAIMVDDCHATGYIGPTGRGTAEHFGLIGKIDLVSSTFGKALGGASGGCIVGPSPMIDMLRQRSRPYLFSNALAPAVAAAGIAALTVVETQPQLRDRIWDNARRFKAGMAAAGFDILPGETAIVPVMLYDERTAVALADALLAKGIYVIGFCYPVVPKGRARIRVQLSAAHSPEQVDRAVAAFEEAARSLGILH